MSDYRETVIKSLEVLVDSRGYLFAEVLNLASRGEMKNIMSAFENGDSYDFELLHFEDCEDKNIKKLISLLKKIEKVFYKIQKENNILTEELFKEN